MSDQKTILNLIILDASGSMRSKVEEVQGGLNQLFQGLQEDLVKQPDVRNKTTVVDFSSHNDFRKLYFDADPSDLKALKEGDYVPRSMTALYDAIGKAFQMVPEDQKDILVTIFTDGVENDSKEWKSADIKSLILEKEAQGWTITFMGTTTESMLAAERIGIKSDKMLRYSDSKAGTKYAFDKLSDARRKYQSSVAYSIRLEDIFNEDNVSSSK